MARDWPHMIEMPGGVRPHTIAPAHWAALERVAADVHRLTGARAWIDRIQRQLCFGYRRHNGRMDLIGGCDFPIFKGGDRAAPCLFDPVTDGVGVRDIVHLIRLARVSPAVKDRWRRELDERQRRDNEEAVNQHLESRVRDFEDAIRFGRSKQGMHSRYQRSVLVNGLKGSAA